MHWRFAVLRQCELLCMLLRVCNSYICTGQVELDNMASLTSSVTDMATPHVVSCVGAENAAGGSSRTPLTVTG